MAWVVFLPYFWTYARIALRSHSRITTVVGWLVVSLWNFSKTVPRIFLTFCMKIHCYEGKKRARSFFPGKIWFSGPKNGDKSKIYGKRLQPFFWILAWSWRTIFNESSRKSKRFSWKKIKLYFWNFLVIILWTQKWAKNAFLDLNFKISFWPIWPQKWDIKSKKCILGPKF